MADPEPKELRTMKEDPFAGLDLAWLEDDEPSAEEKATPGKLPLAQPVPLREEDALAWLLQQVAGPAPASSPAGVPAPPGVDED